MQTKESFCCLSLVHCIFSPTLISVPRMYVPLLLVIPPVSISLFTSPLSLPPFLSSLPLSLPLLSLTYHWRRVVHAGFKMCNSVRWRGPDWVLLICDNRRDSCLSGCGRNLLHGIVIARGGGVSEGGHSRVWGDLSHAVRREWSLWR